MKTRDQGSVGGGPVLHVLPSALGRGAQFYARALVDLLDEPGCRHQLMSIYTGDDGVSVDLSLGEPGGAEAAIGFDPRVAVRLHRLCRKLSPRVLVAHGGDSLKYLAALPRVAPIVYYAIGTVAPAVHRSPRRQLWRRVVARSDVVAAVSDDVARECRDVLGVRSPKLVVVPNGRDAAKFHPRSDLGAHKPPVVVFVGHLTAGKRPDVFVETIRSLRSEGTDLRGLLVGDGPMRQRLEEPARAAGVDLLGKRPDVAGIMRDSDLMIFPSLPEGEGMPGVLIEAGLSGLCVLATDVPGVSAVIDDGVTGSIVGVTDLSGLLGEARRLLSDASERSEMGRAARDRCASLFSMESSASAWRDLLKHIGQ